MGQKAGLVGRAPDGHEESKAARLGWALFPSHSKEKKKNKTKIRKKRKRRLEKEVGHTDNFPDSQK